MKWLQASGGYFPGDKAPRAWSWTHFHLVPRLRMLGVLPPLSHIFSCSGGPQLSGGCILLVCYFFKYWDKFILPFSFLYGSAELRI